MAAPARHVSALPARRSAVHLWWRSRRRRRRVTSTGRRRRLVHRYSVLWWTLVGGAVVVTAAVAYLTVTALMVRSEVARLQSSFSTVQQFVDQGRFTDAQAAAAAVGPAAARAHHLTDGPVWGLAARIPVVGGPLASVKGTTTAVDQLAHSVLPTVTSIAGDLDPARLHPDGSTIDVDTLQRIAPMLHTASIQADAVNRTMSTVPVHTWLPVVDSARAGVGETVSRLAGLLSGADQAAAIAPRLLGVDGTRRYFVGFQNEAESRGTGGLPGAFAIMSATHGRVTFERFESDVALLSYRPDQTVPTGLDFGSEYDRAWAGSDPTGLYVNSNLSAHFPYAAQTWAAMWQTVSGEHLDGAIALDPTALSYLLAVTGPAALPDGTAVSAQDVVDLTQRDAYAKFPSDLAGNTARKEWLVAVTQAAEKQLLSGAGAPAGLVKALARGVGERRILAWSSDPVLESALDRTPAAGVVPDGTAPFAGVVINNAAAGKLDYYVDRRFDYLRTGCGSTRDVQATMTFTNNAPDSGLPTIVTQRLDANAAESSPGDTRVLFDYVASRGATLASVTVNGNPVTASRFTEQGHPVYRVDLELPRGRTTTVVVHLTEPADGRTAPTILVPPAVRDTPVTVADQSCSP